MERRAPIVLLGILLLFGIAAGQNAGIKKLQVTHTAGAERPLARARGPELLHIQASPAQKQQALVNYSRLPLSFEVNQGQSGAPVKYLARGGQFNVFFTPNSVLFGFARRRPRPSPFDIGPQSVTEAPEFSTLEIRLEGASPATQMLGEEQLPGKANYLVGRDRSQWHLNLPTFGKIRYSSIYPGIDLLYYGNEGELESDFVVAPGTDPRAVKLSIIGAENIATSKSGDAILRMKSGEMRLRRPVVYQEVDGKRRDVATNYVLVGKNELAFQVSAYDRQRPLIIDPVLSYSTYLGGNGMDEANAIAVDSNGNAYITGDTSSTNFPVTGTPPNPPTPDMFVTKLSATSPQNPTPTKIYSTYVGGTTNGDFPSGIAIDGAGNAYVVGQTVDPNLPTKNALHPTYIGGGLDGFAFSLSPDGTAFNYFTYLGGTAFDLLTAVAADSLGNAYITGQTTSGDYPVFGGFFGQSHSGGGIFTSTNGGAAWVFAATTLTNPNISYLAVDPVTPTTVYAGTQESGVIKSTNSGASWATVNTGLTNPAISCLVTAVISGQTNVYASTNGGGVFVSNGGAWSAINTGFGATLNIVALAGDPRNPGTLYAAKPGAVFKFAVSTNSWSATGALPAGTTRTTSIIVDPTNSNVYLATQLSGVLRSTDGGFTWAAFNSGLTSLQVTSLAADHLGNLYAATRTGGVFKSANGGSWVTVNNGLPISVFLSLAVDSANNVYVGTWNAGVWKSTNNGGSWSQVASAPMGNTRITALALDPSNSNNVYAGSVINDAVVTKLNSSGQLVFSGYLGGGGAEAGLGIAVDAANGNVYVSGFTNSLNFPTSPAPAQGSMVGGISGFVSKIKADGSGFVYSTYLGGPLTGSAGSDDQAIAIAADTSGNAYVTGITNSAQFPTTNPIQSTLLGADNAFVAQYSNIGQKFFATYLGGEGIDQGNAITVTTNADGSTTAWVAGQTTSQFFPLANPVQFSDLGGGSNAAFVSSINFPSNGTPKLTFSTYLGSGCGPGCGETVAQAIGHDSPAQGNNIYVAGHTSTNSFPSVNGFQTTLAGQQNAFIAKIGTAPNPAGLPANADLSLTLNTFTPTTVTAGGIVTFSLTVTNNGPDAAPNVALGGRGGSNVQLLTCTATQGICGNQVSSIDKSFAELGTLPSGASATVTGVLQALSPCGATCPIIEVDARSDANDPNVANNSVTTNLTVTPGADLAVSLNQSPSTVQSAPANVTYTAAVTNLGPSNASNVTAVLGFSPPTALTFGTVPNNCAPNTATGIVTCILGPMAAGNAAQIAIPVTATAVPLTATVVVSNSPEGDPDAVNNSATLTTGANTGTVNNAELNGHYAFTLRGFDPNGQAIAIGGTFTANGAGNIAGGVLDLNSAATGFSSSAIISGSYTVGADNRGQLTLNTSAGTQTFDFALGSISSISGVASLGHIISRQIASPTNGSAISGIFKLQDTSAFLLSSVNGDWAFLTEGTNSSGNRHASAGRFTLNAGAVSNGSVDSNDNGTFDGGTTNPASFSGNLGVIDSNGRAPLALSSTGGTLNLAAYLVSANEQLLLTTDPIGNNAVQSGSALRQDTSFCPTAGNCAFTNNALNGNAVVYLQGTSKTVAGGSAVQVGTLTFTPGNPPTGTISGSLDKNDGGNVSTPSNGSVAASYSVAPNGRVTITGGNGGKSPFLYLINTNYAFLVGTDSASAAGMGEPQVGPIAFSSGLHGIGTAGPPVSGTEVFDEVQTVTATSSTSSIAINNTVDVNSISGGLREGAMNANFEVNDLDPATGRFTFLSGGNADSPRVGYYVNPNRRITINADPAVTTPYVIFTDAQTIVSSAGPATHCAVNAPPSTAAGAGIAFIVTALDSSNNIATSYSGTVHFSSTDPLATLPANSTLVNGVGSFNATLNTIGNQTLTATDTVNSSITGTSGAIAVNAGTATHFAVSAPAAAIAGASFAFTVTALDSSNNIATSYSGAVHFSSTDPLATLPANSSLVNGVGSFNATLNTTGNQTLTATDTVTSPITGTSGVIAVSAGAATHFAVSAPAAAIAGASFAFTVKALDSSNNIATSYSGAMHFSSTDPLATLPANSTLANGVGSFNATLNTTGNQTLTATDTVNGSITGTSSMIAVSAPSADLAVTMTASPSPIPVLGSVTYQITTTNNGPSPAAGVVLTDSLPADMLFASLDDLTDCKVSNGVLTCTFATMQAGAARIINLMLIPLAVPANGSSNNTVTLTANESDPNLSNNSATAVVQVTGTNPPNGGAVRNLPGFSSNILPGNDDGSTPAVPLQMSLNFFGLQVSSAFVNNNGNITFDSALSEFTPFALNTTNHQIIAPFFADVETDFTGSGLVTYGNDTVNGRPAFGVNWPNVAYFGEGTPGPANFFQVLLMDRSDTGAGNFDIEFNYDKIQWETGDASGGTNGLGGSSARVGYSNGSQTAGSFFELPGSGVAGSFLDSNNTTGLIFNSLNSNQPGRYVFQVRGGTVQSSADLAMNLTGPSSAAAGNTVTYTLTATNLGPNTATGVTITDTLPLGFTFVSASPSNICPAPPTPAAGQPVVVTCSVGSLANGANVIITIEANVTAGTSGTLTDTAIVSAPNNQDLNLGNNTATLQTSVTAAVADLTIAKTHTGNFAQGQVGATYTITVSNSGSGATSGTVSVLDALPAGMTATAMTGNGWNCTVASLACTRSDSLAAGAPYPAITLTVNVAANANTGTLTNTASVSGGGEVNTSNDSASDPTTITSASASLALNVAVLPGDPSGTSISYQLTLTNNGPSATSVQLTDQLSGTAAFVSATSETMTCPAPISGTLTCTQATLINGASAVVVVAVNLTGAGWSSNTVQASSPISQTVAASVQRLSAGGNTLTGTEVAVQPADSITGTSPAILTFANVTRAGMTTVASSNSGAAPPVGYRTGTPAVFYNLSTSATYSGVVGVALGFNGVSFHHPANVRLFHYENGAWVNRTVAVNAAGYVVGIVNSLSPFALFEPVNHAPEAKAGLDRTLPATGAQGSKITLDGSASFDADRDPLTYRWTGPFPEGNGVVTGMSPTVTIPLGGNRVTLVVNDGEVDSAPAYQTITVSDFNLTSAATGATTITAGQSVTFNITANPQFGAFSPGVALTCAGLPQGAQCNFASQSVNAGGPAAALTITTTPRTAALLGPVRHRSLAPLYAMWIPLPGIALIGLGVRRRKRTVFLMLLLLAAMALLVASCGGGSMAATPQVRNGTPAGTYTVIVTGTANGSLQHQTFVKFTVQ